MTQEDKQLLLKDLCARLPYGVRVVIEYTQQGVPGTEEGVFNGYSYEEILKDSKDTEIVSIKPYLRPMSSMTEEEIEEYRNLSDEVIGTYGPYHREFIAHCVRLGIKPDNPHECIDEYVDMDAIDWLNAHHFDYRGLIEKGLALEAPEGMYGKEQKD